MVNPYSRLGMFEKVGVCGAVASIVGLLFAIYVETTSQESSSERETGTEGVAERVHEVPVAKHMTPSSKTTTPRLSTRSTGTSVRFGAGNTDSVSAAVRSGMLELTIRNRLWLSSLLVSYDGSSRGKMRQGDRMPLSEPALKGIHRVRLVAEKGSYDEGRSWYRDVIVE